MRAITPFTGIPIYRQTAKPSFAARMRRIGIKSGIDTLLRGYVDEVRGAQLFPNKIL